MKGTFSILLLILSFSIMSYGQNSTQPMIQNACCNVNQEYKFIYQIKDYELKGERLGEENIKKIQPNWVKSITIYRHSKTIYGLKDHEALILVVFKDRKWKNLPEEL